MGFKYVVVSFSDLASSEISWPLLRFNKECEQVFVDFKMLEHSKENVKILKSKLEKEKADCAISFDFSESLSMACEELGIPYCSWLWDMPLHSLFSDTKRNSVNYIFSFDRAYVDILKKEGAPHVFYLPLCANSYRISGVVVKPEDEKKYSCDVSFVGKFYEDDSEIGKKLMEGLEEPYRTELHDLRNLFMGRWNKDCLLYDVIPDELIEKIMPLCSRNSETLEHYTDREILECNILPRYLAYVERVEMIRRLKDYKPVVYTSSKDIKKELPGITIHGSVDYEESLPKIYYLSRINLSQTLHSIFTGVQLRVFDIMASGGFVLTNYQSELENLFDIDHDMAVYHDFDEMEDLVRFYLSHEKERVRMAVSGYKHVINDYSLEAGVKKMIDILHQG